MGHEPDHEEEEKACEEGSTDSLLNSFAIDSELHWLSKGIKGADRSQQVVFSYSGHLFLMFLSVTCLITITIIILLQIYKLL